MTDDGIVRLGVAQRGRVGALLARAFHDDPMHVAVMPEQGRRAGVLAWLFDRAVHYCLLYGEVYTTPALEGVVCWLPPGRTTLTPGRVVRSGLFATPLKMGWAAYRRFDAYVHYSDGLHARHAPASHWYLWVVGVDPACQGRGIGSRLIQPGLAKASAEGTACYLETGRERNVRFYERHGFEVACAGTVPGQGIRVWAMVR